MFQRHSKQICIRLRNGHFAHCLTEVTGPSCGFCVTSVTFYHAIHDVRPKKCQVKNLVCHETSFILYFEKIKLYLVHSEDC